MADVLSQLFADAGNTLRATATGFRSGHEPVHSSSSGACVSIDPEKGTWHCFPASEAAVPLRRLCRWGVSRAEAEDDMRAQRPGQRQRTQEDTS